MERELMESAVENYVNGNLKTAKKALREDPELALEVARDMLPEDHAKALVLWAVGAMDFQELCDVAAKEVAR